MATSATLQARLYQRFLEDSGYICLSPDADEVEQYCTRQIQFVKENRIEESFESVSACVQLMRQRGA